MSRKRCHCTSQGVECHVPGCHPARPLCRWMRKRRDNRRVCYCAAYHFPHRRGSGKCGHPERIEDERLAALHPNLTPEQRSLVLTGKANPGDFKQTG